MQKKWLYQPLETEFKEYESLLEKIDEIFKKDIEPQLSSYNKPPHIKNNYSSLNDVKKIILKKAHQYSYYFVDHKGRDITKNIESTLHPLMIKDPDVCLAWCDRSTSHWQAIWDNQEFKQHLQNPKFIKKVLLDSKCLSWLWLELAKKNKQYWSTKWFAQAAVTHYIDKKFLKENLPNISTDKELFVYHCKNSNPSNLFTLFEPLFDDTELVLKAVGHNPYYGSFFPEKLKQNIALIEKLIEKNPKWISTNIIPQDKLLDDKYLELLKQLPSYERVNYFRPIASSCLQNKSQWLKYLNNITGYGAVETIAERSIEILPWLNKHPDMLAVTMEKISEKITDNSGASYIELMGGALYNKHSVQEFLSKIAKTNTMIKLLSENYPDFFHKPTNLQEFEKYEDNLQNLWHSFEPIYLSSYLNKQLPINKKVNKNKNKI